MEDLLKALTHAVRKINKLLDILIEEYQEKSSK